MARLGVIDLGSNTIRLVIYETKEGDASGKPFRTLIDKKKVVGLSSYVEDGVFTREGIDRAIDVLSELLSLALNLKCDRTGLFATAVLRNCKNSKKATRSIEAAIDHEVHVLSEKDEAHLGFVGASIGQKLKKGTLIDIGGGSTELTVLRHDGDHDGMSLPAGCVALYADYVRLVMPTPEECRAMQQAFEELLDKAGNLEEYCAQHAFGIGGTLRGISKLLAQVHELSSEPESFTAQDLSALFRLMESKPGFFAHSVVKATPDRVHSLVPGMIIARTLMEQLGIRDIVLCKHGIREGYLLKKML